MIKAPRSSLKYGRLTSMVLRVYVFLALLLSISIPSAFAQDLEHIGKNEPFKVYGGINARTMFYQANGIQPRYLPFNYVISGTPVLSIYGIQVPVYFSFSRQQSSFTQPFNQFGMSPTYKWITVHAGYRNLQYSPFTLNGHTILGAGVELHPQKWRIGGIYGRLNKATPLDTLRGVYTENFSFKRMGYALKLGYGTEANHFDLIALHGKDDITTTPLTDRLVLDSLKITPSENFVTGYQSKFSMIKGKLIFESDGAFSMYTTDIRSSVIEDEAINSRLKSLDKLTTINYSTEIYGAFQASLMYKVRLMSLKLQYRYIEPSYKSMGSYFLNNDLENITINPTAVLLKGKIRFTGSLGLQRDNLQNLKRATAKRVIGAANLSAELTNELGLDLSYTNFSNTQRVRTIRFADTLRIAQSTQNYSVSPRYFYATAAHSHSVILSANYNTFRELNASRSLEDTGNEITTSNYFGTYQVGFVASRATLFASLNHTKSGSQSIHDKNYGLTIGGSKAFSKMMLSLSSGYQISDRNGMAGRIINSSFQARYNANSRHSFQAMLMFLGNYPEHISTLQRKFTEVRSEVGYTYNF
jgi:hypothetical protein